MELNDLIPQWKAALLADGRRTRGITRYVNEVRAYARWSGPGANIACVNTARIARYTEAMAARGCKASTMKSALSALRCFSLWGVSRSYLDADPTVGVPWPKRRQGKPRPLKAEQVRQVLEALALPDDLPPTYAWMWQRNRLAVLIMLYAGFRISEVVALCWDHVDFDAETITVINGKNGEDRTIPMHPTLMEELRAWGPRKASQAVVCKLDGKPLGYKSLGHVFERWLPERGVCFQSHRLRHTFATQLLREGANLREVQELMGHAKLETTAIYTEVLAEHLRPAVQRLPAAADW